MVQSDQPWQINQANSITVEVDNLEAPLLLIIEVIPLIERVGAEPLLPPGAQPDTPPIPVRGVITLRRIGPGPTRTSFVLPLPLSAPTMNGETVQGWNLRVTLTDRIDVFPLATGPTLGAVYPIRTDAVTTEQTWVESEADRFNPIGSPEDAHLVIPNSASGMFLYYPYESIRETILLTATQGRQFEERS